MTVKRRSERAARRGPVGVLVGAVVAMGAGVVGYRVVRRRAAGVAEEMFGQGGVPGDIVESAASEAAPSGQRVTANERSDGVRRTGDDRLVRPVAAGETDSDAAADPTITPGTTPGRSTGVEPDRNQ